MRSRLKLYLLSLIALAFIQVAPATPAPHFNVAITFDDLPLQGALQKQSYITAQDATDTLRRISQILQAHHIAGVWGFASGQVLTQYPAMQAALDLWQQAGHHLGNHGFSHLDLAKVPAKTYIADMARNQRWLERINPHNTHDYYRYPFLAYGETATKYQQVQRYLKSQGIKVAYVTMDFFDSEWTPAYYRCSQQQNKEALDWLSHSYLQQARHGITIARTLSQSLFGRDIDYVLLIHASPLQAQILDKLLTEYERAGARFIPLSQALHDPVYRIEPAIYRNRAYTLLNRIRLAEHRDNPPEVSRLYASLPEDQLNRLCR